jgi:arginine/lysine/ornithine decarboxylase
MKCDLCGKELDGPTGYLVLRWISKEGFAVQEKTLSSFCFLCFIRILTRIDVGETKQ